MSLSRTSSRPLRGVRTARSPRRSCSSRSALPHTSFGDPPTGVSAARGSVSGRGVTSAELRSTNVGTGDVWSTTADLARWPRALASGDVLNETSRKAIFTRQAHITASEGSLTDIGYCYGWYSARCRSMPIVFHTGDQPGFTSLLVWIRDRDTVVAVLAADDVKLLPSRILSHCPTADQGPLDRSAPATFSPEAASLSRTYGAVEPTTAVFGPRLRVEPGRESRASVNHRVEVIGDGFLLGE